MAPLPGPITQAGFLAFVRGTAGIPSSVLPDNSPAIGMAYRVAVDIVNLVLAIASPDMYVLAVYNLGVDNLINFAPDVQPPVAYKPPPPLTNEAGLPYFAFYRAQWKIYDFQSGVVQSAGDEGTTTSLVVQKAAENFTLSNLQNLKTPFGRQYLAIAQRTGTNWGLT